LPPRTGAAAEGCDGFIGGAGSFNGGEISAEKPDTSGSVELSAKVEAEAILTEGGGLAIGAPSRY
jgi:hypothetical protein